MTNVKTAKLLCAKHTKNAGIRIAEGNMSVKYIAGWKIVPPRLRKRSYF